MAKSEGDRRPRGWLEKDVKQIVDKYVNGKLDKKLDGKPLTPHRVAVLVKEVESLEEAPSTGACAAVFKRWETLGFAKFNQKPFSFKEYTPKGLNLGLDGMKAARGEQRKATRAAEKAANPKPAKKAAAKKTAKAPAKKAAAKKAS